MAPRTPPTDKTFLDATVLFSAAYSSRGRARDLLLAGIRGELPLALSDLVLTETERNLARKAPQAVALFQTLQPVLLPYVINPPLRTVRRAELHIELKDAAIVAGALAAHARFLATYDRHHLLNHAEEIQRLFGLLVMTPDAILVALSE